MEQMRREFLSVLHDLEIHAINAFYDNKKAEIDRAISSMFNLLLFWKINFRTLVAQTDEPQSFPFFSELQLK